MSREPLRRGILVVDIEGFGRRDWTDPIRARLRERLHKLLADALAAAEIPPEKLEQQSDLGDGRLVLADPHISIARLLHPLIPQLAAQLASQNQHSADAERLRLRVAIHDGQILADAHGGHTGADLIHAFRLLDAEAVRAVLRSVPAADMVVVISDLVWKSIVSQKYPSIDPADFQSVRIHTKETRTLAWVHVVGQRKQPRLPARFRPRWIAANGRLLAGLVGLIALLALIFFFRKPPPPPPSLPPSSSPTGAPRSLAPPSATPAAAPAVTPTAAPAASRTKAPETYIALPSENPNTPPAPPRPEPSSSAPQPPPSPSPSPTTGDGSGDRDLYRKGYVSLTTPPGHDSVYIDYLRKVQDGSGDLRMDQDGIYPQKGAALVIIEDAPDATYSRCAGIRDWAVKRVNFNQLRVGSQLCARSYTGRYASMKVTGMPSETASREFVFFARVW